MCIYFNCSIARCCTVCGCRKCSALIYLIPLSSVDEDTLAVRAIVGIAMAASIGLIIVVIAVVVAVTVFTRWWKEKDSGTLDLTTDVSMECSMQTPYCVLQEFVCIWHKMLSNICIII